MLKIPGQQEITSVYSSARNVKRIGPGLPGKRATIPHFRLLCCLAAFNGSALALAVKWLMKLVSR